MRTPQPARVALLVVAAALSAAACNQQPAAMVEVQTTTAAQPRMEPISVVGCLKGGVLADTTWVLLERAPDALSTDKASTYQLVGGTQEMLRSHAGNQVQISGTLESEQQVASSSGGPVEDKARGTSGTPRIDTTAAIEVKRLRVDSLTPMGGRCD